MHFNLPLEKVHSHSKEMLLKVQDPLMVLTNDIYLDLINLHLNIFSTFSIILK